MGSKEDVLDNAAGRLSSAQHRRSRPWSWCPTARSTPLSFQGAPRRKKERLQERGEIFGYVYCGLRERSDDHAPNGEQAYRLRTPAEIEAEFLSALARVREADRLENLLEVLKPLLRDPSFQCIPD